jgi:hypothetical protein
MEENPYEAPQVAVERARRPKGRRRKPTGSIDVGRFLVSLIFTAGAAYALFYFVVAIGYVIVGTELGRELAVIFSLVTGVACTVLLVFAYVATPAAMERARTMTQYVLLMASLLCGISYWLGVVFHIDFAGWLSSDTTPFQGY